MNVIRLIKERQRKWGEGNPCLHREVRREGDLRVQVQKPGRVKTKWILTPGGTAVLGFAVKHT